MEIKVFGPGCAKCTQTEQLVRDIVKAQGIDVTVTKVSDIKEMMLAGIMSTPAVAVDGVLKSTGKIPSRDEILAWIDGATGAASSDINTTGALASPASGGCCSCGGKC